MNCIHGCETDDVYPGEGERPTLCRECYELYWFRLMNHIAINNAQSPSKVTPIIRRKYGRKVLKEIDPAEMRRRARIVKKLGGEEFSLYDMMRKKKRVKQRQAEQRRQQQAENVPHWTELFGD